MPLRKAELYIIDMFLRLPNETIDRITCSVGIIGDRQEHYDLCRAHQQGG